MLSISASFLEHASGTLFG